jgi:ParB-like chromosome segregation protein Spo0J
VTDRLIPKITKPRTHSREQVANIAASIREFGLDQPDSVIPRTSVSLQIS